MGDKTQKIIIREEHKCRLVGDTVHIDIVPFKVGRLDNVVEFKLVDEEKTRIANENQHSILYRQG